MLRNSLEKISVSFCLEPYISKLLLSEKKKKKYSYISYDEEESKRKMHKNISGLCENQLNLFTNLLQMMSVNSENKVMAEIKLYSSNCCLYFKK